MSEHRDAARCGAVAFDVLETLLDLDPLADRLEAVGQPRGVLGPWFMRFQRDAMALTLAGDVAPFDAVARDALRVESGRTMNRTEIDHVLDGFAELPTFPDAEPALRRLAEAEVRIGCLTVGDPENTRRFLEGAGLAVYVDEVITAEMAGVWKPAPGIYRTAAEKLASPLDRMALVAVHAWDCHGAKRAGALAGWCARLEGEHAGDFLPADVHGADLVEVVDGLLALS
ncbi:haloacid dehalogenase type II [Actinomycetospora straminea]|uniref:2-haloacid dehalogenase n=1 Tax=Actinomycetospora straminea TaxID=663607 RepID=A0ABP9EIS0_9PSEU|nr:haloacid dehalogenase type II [Actinomycetospora straminea]MDD7933134.1 haloacid dehalogenase type II [Actinomycetospora straminea]